MKIRNLISLPVASLLGAFVALGQANAQTVVQWNFNSNPADAATSTGTLAPSAGVGTIATFGGLTATFATGSPGDPAAAGNDNSGWNLTTWAAQGTGSGTRGLQVAASTVGFTDLILALDFRQSGTVSRFFQLQVSFDGSTFNDASGGIGSFGTVGSGNTGTSFSNTGLYSNNPGGGSQTFVQSITYTFASGSIYENDPNFAFRWAAVFDPANGTNYISANAGTTTAYSTSGTGRFDGVSLSGTVVPEPTVVTLAGLAAVSLLAVRRRQ